ncbi:MAG: sodium-dependent transporter [Bacteroidales bacterium]|nr:sodium-dependent transporter [Bacteroidales bacterium]MDY2693240.1 sodium-dependent transporter [Prevotella sp.]MDY6027695.1 sodium-dependent transporter [Prevotella sp.]
METTGRTNFGSRLGVVLATAGSAVGLGNVWRFPYMVGNDGGAAFIVVYLCCVLFLGIPGMVAEFVVGRASHTNAARAYRSLSDHPLWGITGYVGVITSMIILGFYAVVAGWCLQYLYASLTEQLQGSKEYVVEYFTTFSTSLFRPAVAAVLFILITHHIVAIGVRGGIERASKLLMPMLFIILIILVVASCLLPGAWGGITFMLKPDFSRITRGVLLDALGQAFFSLSLGTACLTTYASYFKSNTQLSKSAVNIALIDILVALLAGMVIFPAAFSVGVRPDAGPSLIFITLPNVFQQAFVHLPITGYCISVLFYALMALAALTSTISMHEIGTAFFHEELHISRKAAAWVVTSVCSIIAILSALSMAHTECLQLQGRPLMECFDYVTAQVLMPLGSLATCLFVGWVLPKRIVAHQLTNGGTLKAGFAFVFLFVVKYICPIAIAAIFLHQFGVF